MTCRPAVGPTRRFAVAAVSVICSSAIALGSLPPPVMATGAMPATTLATARQDAASVPPRAPRSVTALAGHAMASVGWAAPARDGGSPITGYIVTATPGGGGCRTSDGLTRTCIVRGLRDGTRYTFRVRAVSAAGTGPASRTTAAVIPSAAVTLRRYPYLTDTTTTTATVNVATTSATPAPVILWGPASGDCVTPPGKVTATAVTSFTIGVTKDYQFKAPISGLAADTAYCYRVTQAGVDQVGSAIVFRTALAPSATAAFSFAVIGDWGAGTVDQARVFSQIAAAAPSFVVTTGDNTYNSGTQSDYGDLTAGNAFPPQYVPTLGGGTPIFATHGNHGFTSYSAYLQNFPQDAVVAASGGSMVAQSYCCAAGTSGTHTYASSWYAFTWGNARFYVLEAAWADGNGGYQGDFTSHWNGPVTGCAPCGQELSWLSNDLAANASVPLKFAFFHYPLYADSSSQAGDSYLQGAGRLEGLLASHGVGIVFNGHAHIYERNRPRIAGSPMVSYVTGGGGAALGGVSGCSSFDAFALGSNSSCNAPKPTAAQVYHYLRVSVSGNQVTVIPTDETGHAFDVQTYTFGPVSSATVPGAPTAVTATGGNAQATVGWNAPASDGGSPILSYTATSSPGGRTCSTADGLARSCVVGGLTNGTSYTFTVHATNAIGSGSESTASAPVTPVAGSTLLFAPNADATLLAASPTTNSGGSTTLQVDNSPVKNFLIRFVVSGVGSGHVTSAKLRLACVDNSPAGGDFALAETTAWAENTVTWATAPAVAAGSPVVSLGKVVAGTAYDLDVTSLIHGDGTYTLRVTSPNSDGADYTSKDGVASSRPQLTITIG
jgi:hypothetical protein